MEPPFDVVVPIAAAALGGAAVGVEREWSGHAIGPTAHFGGVRTFTLLGGVAGIAGWLARGEAPVLGIAIAAGAIALVVAAYAAASRRDIDGTTEVAALVVIAAGVASGLGALELASGIVAITCLLLLEKSRLHALVARLGDVELRAATRFAVMAVVVLPLLPPGPYGPLGGVRPRQLWLLVLIFSGLSFVGYAARRVAGATRGHVVAGLLAGLVSSTGVTFAFARESRRASALASSLALGVVGASALMFFRLLVATFVLDPRLARAATVVLGVPGAVGVAGVLAVARRVQERGGTVPPASNPLQLAAALQMAATFQAVLFVVTAVRRFGESGLLATSALVGLTDTDALTLGVVRAVQDGTPYASAVWALVIGCLSNTLFKLGAAMWLGAPAFRRRTAMGLAMLAMVLVLTAVVAGYTAAG